MTDRAVRFHFDGPVALIGGGQVDEQALREARARACALVAADGGANRFVDSKHALDAVIGDLDSLRDEPAWRAALGDRLLRLAEQDTTDLEKCLYSVAAPLYLGVGFQGARVDHSLAAAHLLLKRADRRLMLIEESDVLFLAPRRWRIRLPVGARVSLFPLAETRAERSAGLRWPVDGMTLRIGDRIGTSNETVAEAVSIDFASPVEAGPAAGLEAWSGVLAMIERDHLDAAIESVSRSGPRGEEE